MNIPFQTYSKAVQKENRYLREALGSEHNHARYQWAWSEDIQLPMVELTEDGKLIYDMHCVCGINRSVHSSHCKFTVPRPRWSMSLVLGTMRGRWVLVKWAAPEVEESEWERTFGGIPYPSDGYHKPVGTETQCIAMYGEPLHPTSQECVKQIREHFTVTEKARNQQTRDKWDRMDQQRRDGIIDMCKNAFPVHTGYAGKKEEWSGQAGLGESPVIRKLTEGVV